MIKPPPDEERGSKGGARVTRDVPAVTRALHILRSLARNKQPIGVVSLARELKMIPSTCLHILRVLHDNGMVSFNPRNKRYTLGPGVLAFATAYSQLNPLVQVVRGHLQELARKHNCAFAAIERSGTEHYIVVAATELAPGLSIRLAAGARFPVLISAAGLCFAAFDDMTQEQMKERFAKLRSDNLPSFARWLKQVEEVRDAGYAADSGQYMRGIAVVAVPIFDNDGCMLGCLSAVGVREQISGQRHAALVQDVREAAASVSREMGHGATIEHDIARLAPTAPRKARRRQP